ncbi:MAG: hypothetical protein RL120_01885, partial [Gammaproteobacteria bacterium]
MSSNCSESSHPRTALGRRNFLRGAALLSAAAGPMALSLAQGRTVERVGLQLYTLRNEMARDFAGTLARVAEL